MRLETHANREEAKGARHTTDNLEGGRPRGIGKIGAGENVVGDLTSMDAVILIGIQGAGKTTFYREHFCDTHVRISLDVLKTRLRERMLLNACLKSGQPFAIDNTNVRITERAVYIEAAKRAGFRVKGYFFDVQFRDAIRRNVQREGVAKIPVAGIGGTWKRLERPSPSEGYDELYVVSRDENDQFVVKGWREAEGSAIG